MIKNLSVDWLKKKGACPEAIPAFQSQTITEPRAILRELIKRDKLDWADWLIVRLMSYKQYVSYAVYAAEQVIKNYEKKYPDDKRL